MKFRLPSINIYLILAIVALGSGCQTGASKHKKEASTLRLHLEVNPDGTERNGPVPVYRAHPVLVNVEKEAFLTEHDVTRAAVVDQLGGFAIKVQFDREGTRLLEMFSTANKGKRVAIFSQFGEARWLAAPQIFKNITDGTLVFTPDATREEADRIVRGLNAVAKQIQKQSRW